MAESLIRQPANEKLGIEFSTSLFYVVCGSIHCATAASSAFDFAG